jgi:N6-L-threonylcarbamoyladenine synthase
MAAAVVRRGTEIVSSVIRGQDAVHQPYGGVVPELASRDHVRTVSDVVKAALAEAQVDLPQLDAVAVTAGPGLIGSLLVGLSFGKALAYQLGIPMVGVHHLSGHLASAELADPSLRPPYLGLLTSGGHTAIFRIEADAEPELLGETRDDAAGEAFDKVAKLLGLGFPGGPAVAAAAAMGDAKAIDFPRPMARSRGLDFSFSGLKTAVALEVERRAGQGSASAGQGFLSAGQGSLSERDVADIAASFEAAAIDVLVTRLRRAVKEQGLERVSVVGGVAANQRLREEMARVASLDRFKVSFPPLALCTDNAAMIAAAGARLLTRGDRHGLDLNSFSRGAGPL